MEVNLQNGGVAIVDDQDWPLVSQYSWRLHRRLGYAMTSQWRDGKAQTIYMHRLINATPPGWITDHIDRDGLNNRRENLRTVNHSQNALNCKLHSSNSSGFRGVQKTRRRWRATLIYNGVREHLGVFDTPHQASEAYEARRAMLPEPLA